MDVRVSSDRASNAEREAVDRICSSTTHRTERIAASGVAASRDRRPLLLDGLWALQESAGHISRGGLNYLCVRLGVAPADAFGVASAYALFSMTGPHLRAIHVCDDVACRAAQGGDPFDAGEGEPSVHRSPCLGHCEFGSAALLVESGPEPLRRTIAPFAPDERGPGAAVLNGPENTQRTDGAAPTPALAPQVQGSRLNLRLLKRLGLGDPTSLDSFLRLDGFAALGRALEMGPEAVVGEVKTAKLLGRGGAAFPAGVKWEGVFASPVMPHFFVCNADESEPGTFKDRLIMENDPFAVVEAVTIGGYATSSAKGYIYIRGEYPLAEARLRSAVDAARRAGYLGPNIQGSDFTFEIEVRRGAGAYIAGEETALFNSIEGRRPEPRNKPPFPTQSGLFGKPTAANNVETLLNVPGILLEGASSFAGIGTDESTGTRLFCVSGSVDRPGVYELPMGTSLRELLDLAGAFAADRQIRAVLLGGAAGMFVGPEELDVPLSFEGARAKGVTLGSGVVIVFDQRTDFNGIMARLARFFRDESCGQCVPCRVGTVRQEEMVSRLATGRPHGSAANEAAMYEELTRAMKDASICGLGQTATTAIESAMRLGLFPDRTTGALVTAS